MCGGRGAGGEGGEASQFSTYVYLEADIPLLGCVVQWQAGSEVAFVEISLLRHWGYPNMKRVQKDSICSDKPDGRFKMSPKNKRFGLLESEVSSSRWERGTEGLTSKSEASLSGHRGRGGLLPKPSSYSSFLSLTPFKRSGVQRQSSVYPGLFKSPRSHEDIYAPPGTSPITFWPYRKNNSLSPNYI